jgi:hypothetical protein
VAFAKNKTKENKTGLEWLRDGADPVPLSRDGSEPFLSKVFSLVLLQI